MSFQTQLSSDTFNIEHTSKEIDFNRHFHTKEMEIIRQGQPRKVVYGQMQQEERSVYEIISPYMETMAKTTGNIAVEAGKIAYEYLKQGFWWLYDQVTNKLIPYTKQEIPKLIFIIAKSTRPQNAIKSGEFCVLEMQDEDYRQIARKQRQRQGSIKVLIPLGQKDQALIQEIKKNHEVSYSFPIDDLDGESQRMSVTYCIPSESYEIIENEAKAALYVEKSRQIDITQTIEPQMKTSQKVEHQYNEKQSYEQQQKQSNQTTMPKQQITLTQTNPKEASTSLSIRKASQSQQDWQQMNESLMRQKPKPKAIFLPDACCFIYEQEDELYPFLKQRLDAEDSAIVGHLVSSERFKKRQDGRDSSSGQTPLIMVDQKIGTAIEVRKEVAEEEFREKHNNMRRDVNAERNVRLQIGEQREREHNENGLKTKTNQRNQRLLLS